MAVSSLCAFVSTVPRNGQFVAHRAHVTTCYSFNIFKDWFTVFIWLLSGDSSRSDCSTFNSSTSRIKILSLLLPRIIGVSSWKVRNGTCIKTTLLLLLYLSWYRLRFRHRNVVVDLFFVHTWPSRTTLYKNLKKAKYFSEICTLLPLRYWIQLHIVIKWSTLTKLSALSFP